MAFRAQSFLDPQSGWPGVAEQNRMAVKLGQGFDERSFDNCGKSVPKMKAVLAAKRGSVFHVQRMLKDEAFPARGGRQAVLCTHLRNTDRLGARSMLVGVALAVFQAFLPVGYTEDKECINFYTVGDSKCEPAEKPVESASGSPKLIPPPSVKSEDQKVDEYLENYGKPPREFVQFYMNPTPDNAQKWVEAYQGIVQKSQNLSKMWEDAERLYNQQGSEPTLRRTPAVNPVTTPQPVAQPQSAPSVPAAQASSLGNFGGLNAVPAKGQAGGVMPQDRGLKLTYYFSQVCPYCARMTPELSVITNNYSGKLEFTCVDVTPFSGETAPNPAYLRDKLACQWRLPQEGELQREGVNQTPTLLVQQGGQAQVKLSGYMSQEQLKPYFAR